MRREPGLEVAREYLAKLVGAARSSHQVRLPLLKQMAIDAGVSHAVMGKAVASLRGDGVLDVRQGRGIELVADAADPKTAPLGSGQSLRWQRLKAQLHREAADGLFEQSRLPSQKELASRYRVSPKTLGKALRSLERDGVLRPEGRRYQVAGPTRVSGRNTIVLFARSGSTGEVAVYTTRTSAQFSVLEQICSSRNVCLQIVLCQFEGTRLTFPGWESGSLAELFGSRQVLGFMVWRLGLTPDFTSELVARLHRLGKPTAIFVENPDDLRIPGLPADRLVRRYTTSPDFEAGRAVGNLLTSRGHRRVCCWADSGELAWARDRLAGLRRAFSDAGLPDGVEFHSAWTDEYLYDSEKVQQIQDHLRRAVGRVSQELAVPIRPERMSDAVAGLYFTGIYREHVFHTLEPLMRQSLRRRDATAWVGTTDMWAVECLRYLRASAVDVPQQVSVIGFDDSPDAATCRLSSYNFNGTAAVHRMVDFLLWPGAPIARAEPGKPVEVQGFVHERATTGVASQAASR